MELKMQSLVLMLIPPDTQMCLSMTKAALALPILAVTSRSVTPCWSTTLPSQTKDPHLPDRFPTNCDWCVGSCVHLNQLGLLPVDLEPCPLLMWSPGEWFCPVSACDCVKGAPGHQQSRGRLPVVVVFMIQSMTRRKRNGESRYPCRTPVFTSKRTDSWTAWAILQLVS